MITGSLQKKKGFYYAKKEYEIKYKKLPNNL